MTTGKLQFIGFKLDGTQHALPLDCVARVIRVVDITPLPDAPKHLLGIINLQGNLVPVLDIRTLFHLPQRDIDLADLMVIFHNQPQKPLALIADEIINIIEVTPEEWNNQEISQENAHKTVISKQHGLIFIHDPQNFQGYSGGHDE